ncbi:MAG: V-type ATP synthase subunit K [Eubacteriaceae bacterium]|nr:V-type ATP synthase subunit K [Eubacteriaceae bacterium]
MDVLNSISLGAFFAMLGAGLAAGFGGAGSGRGVGIAGEAAAGVISEDPNKFGQTLLLQALPGTQGIYGLLIAFLILNKIGLFSGASLATVTLGQGLMYLAASVPGAIALYHSGIGQGRASAASMGVLAKRPEEFGKCMLYPAMVETYAVLALLVSVLMLMNVR